MARPENNRMIHEPPLFSGFKPEGVRGYVLEKETLTLDEYEAFRLADHMGMSHEEASVEMGISRPVFSKLIERSRKKIASLIVEGKKLIIEGGKVHFRQNIIRCQSCGHMFKTNIETFIDHCPECDSDHLINMAGGYGHGLCCREEGDGQSHGHRHRHRQRHGKRQSS